MFTYGIQRAAHILLKETLRLLPWTDNQITPLFVQRVVKHDLVLPSSMFVPKRSNMCVVRCLEHLDPTSFPTPRLFAPARWLTPSMVDCSLRTFGIGRRRCCGEALSWKWLGLPLEAYWRSGRFCSPRGVRYRLYSPRVCGIQEFVFVGKMQPIRPDQGPAPGAPVKVDSRRPCSVRTSKNRRIALFADARSKRESRKRCS